MTTEAREVEEIISQWVNNPNIDIGSKDDQLQLVRRFITWHKNKLAERVRPVVKVFEKYKDKPNWYPEDYLDWWKAIKFMAGGERK